MSGTNSRSLQIDRRVKEIRRTLPYLVLLVPPCTESTCRRSLLVWYAQRQESAQASPRTTLSGVATVLLRGVVQVPSGASGRSSLKSEGVNAVIRSVGGSSLGTLHNFAPVHGTWQCDMPEMPQFGASPTGGACRARPQNRFQSRMERAKAANNAEMKNNTVGTGSTLVASKWDYTRTLHALHRPSLRINHQHLDHVMPQSEAVDAFGQPFELSERFVSYAVSGRLPVSMYGCLCD